MWGNSGYIKGEATVFLSCNFRQRDANVFSSPPIVSISGESPCFFSNILLPLASLISHKLYRSKVNVTKHLPNSEREIGQRIQTNPSRENTESHCFFCATYWNSQTCWNLSLGSKHDLFSLTRKRLNRVSYSFLFINKVVLFRFEVVFSTKTKRTLHIFFQSFPC